MYNSEEKTHGWNFCYQVKRYIDLYSLTSVLGFPDEDLQLVSELYTKAQESWSSSIITASAYSNDAYSNILPILKNQINIYSHFLEKVAELARSKWTEFDLKFMGIGLGVMFFSLLLHFAAMMKVHQLFKSPYPHINNSWTSSRVLIPLLLVGIRANSFLSNSYICKLSFFSYMIKLKIFSSVFKALIFLHKQ